LATANRNRFAIAHSIGEVYGFGDEPLSRIDRGFCRVTGRFRKKKTRVTLLRCFDSFAAVGPGCTAAVSAH